MTNFFDVPDDHVRVNFTQGRLNNDRLPLGDAP